MEKWKQESKRIEQLEEQDRFLNDQKLSKALTYFKWLATSNGLRYLDYQEEENTKDRFLKNYILLSKEKPEEIKLYLKQNKLKESSLLHELLYLFIEKDQIKDMITTPLVKDLTIDNGIYQIVTTIGTVKLGKASDYFKDTPTSLVLKRKLTEMCFERTEEFIEQNPEYQAIVAATPNLFTGSHLHAYAKKDDVIVDSACNAIFFDNTGEMIEEGNIIYQTSVQELQQEAKIEDCSRLYVATMKNKVLTKR